MRNTRKSSVDIALVPGASLWPRRLAWMAHEPPPVKIVVLAVWHTAARRASFVVGCRK